MSELVRNQENKLFSTLPGPQEIEFRSGTGLAASTRYGASGVLLGGREVFIGNEGYTRLDFEPGGRSEYDGRNVTDSIISAIEGFEMFVEYVEREGIAYVPPLIGSTNRNMAIFAARFGFKLDDRCFTPEGKISKSLLIYKVIGDFDQLRKNLKKFQQTSTYDKLYERYAREYEEGV